MYVNGGFSWKNLRREPQNLLKLFCFARFFQLGDEFFLRNHSKFPEVFIGFSLVKHKIEIKQMIVQINWAPRRPPLMYV